MTREEAIKIISDPKYQTYPDGWLDQLAALGLLKFDEPKKTVEQRLETIAKRVTNIPFFVGMLRDHGLKIVDANES